MYTFTYMYMYTSIGATHCTPVYIYKHTSNQWESNHRNGPTGHKKHQLNFNITQLKLSKLQHTCIYMYHCRFSL